MKPTAPIVSAALAFAAMLSAPAHAQNARSFVSGHGDDANTCTLLQPCRTFAVAFMHTNAGGEIDVLDPAGYGTLTITHAISIVNDGVGTSSMLVPSAGIGITINAGANDAVNLRGLTIEGAGTGATGIQFNAGASLTIERCVIRHFASIGLAFAPIASSNLTVSDTLVADTDTGIDVFPNGAGTFTALFNRVNVINNNNDAITVGGSASTGTIDATASDTISAGNAGVGFTASTSAGHASTTFTLFHSVAANNNTGLIAQGGATLRAAQSMVTGNSSGWLTSTGGVVESYGDNYIDGNQNNETAPPTAPPAKK
jgi:hypothetical protein